jgi:hypothetical protein
MTGSLRSGDISTDENVRLGFGNPVERAAVHALNFDVVEIGLVYFDH